MNSPTTDPLAEAAACAPAALRKKHDVKVSKLCRCGRTIPDRGTGSRPRSRCPECEREHAAAKRARQKRDGRTRYGWQVTRRKVIERDQGICQSCGCVADPPTVHSLVGGFHEDDPNLYVLLCLSCHGRVDARKAAARNTKARYVARKDAIL